MTVEELIERLNNLPKNLPIRALNWLEDDDTNEWVVKVQEENEGTRYHSVILITSE